MDFVITMYEYKEPYDPELDKPLVEAKPAELPVKYKNLNKIISLTGDYHHGRFGWKGRYQDYNFWLDNAFQSLSYEKTTISNPRGVSGNLSYGTQTAIDTGLARAEHKDSLELVVNILLAIGVNIPDEYKKKVKIDERFIHM
jgi:hypothetical protein